MFSSLRALLPAGKAGLTRGRGIVFFTRLSPLAAAAALAALLIPAAAAQTRWIIQTVAGRVDPGDGGAATAAALYSPVGVAVDGAGNVYFADAGDHRIRRVDASTGNISTAAGDGTGGDSGDGGAATAAQLNEPYGVAVDGTGNLYIADTLNSRVRKVDASTGNISTAAGDGTQGDSGDGGAATAAQLNNPYGVAVDGAGNLYIADTLNSRVRKVDASTGNISTTAGTGTAGYSGDGGAATAARLDGPFGVAVDGANNLYIADTGNHCIRKVDASTGNISTAVGDGTRGDSGDGGAATAARLDGPFGVAVDGANNLYIADMDNHRIRRVDASTGNISTAAGDGTRGDSGDGGAATGAQLNGPSGVAVDGAGNLYIAAGDRIRKVGVPTPTRNISTVAGTISDGDGEVATAARLYSPTGVAVDGSGNLYIADGGSVRKVDASTGNISTAAGTGTSGYSGDGGAATAAQIGASGLALDGSDNLYIAGYNRIRKVDVSTGNISTVAGTGTAGYSGDGGAATAAQLDGPSGVAVDGSGNVYIADRNNGRIRRVDASTGMIATFAGTGTIGYGGDGGAATAAPLYSPDDVVVDGSGNVYITDAVSVRKVDASTGNISTAAGDGTNGFSGDGGAATAARLYPAGVAVDASGNVYIADWDRIRKVDASTGIITTFAGTGKRGFSGDGGAATAAQLDFPNAVAVDGSGNVYIADTGNRRIRRVRLEVPPPPDPQARIEAIGGDGTAGFSGDGGNATEAKMHNPSGTATDAAGAVYIADTRNHRIRRIAPDGTIDTFAGDGAAGNGGDGAAAEDAQLNGPRGVAADGAGNIYIADTGNHRIRKVNAAGNIAAFAGTGTAGDSGDGGAATAAQLNNPYGVAADGAGNVYIADTGNHRIRRVDAAGNIAAFAGTGAAGYSGDGGAATAAQLNNPYGVTADAAGNVYIADSGNDRLRRVDRAGQITTFSGGGSSAGTPLSYRGSFAAALTQGGPRGIRATAILLERPSGALVDGAGNVYIADSGNNRILKVDGTQEVTVAAGGGGSADEERLDNPWGLAADRSGGVYFTDRGNHRLRSLRLQEPTGPGRSQPEPSVFSRTFSLSFTLAQDAAPSPQTIVLYADDEAAEFEVRPSARWLTVSPARGRLAAGAETTVTVTVDPTGLREGTHNGRLYVRAGGRVSAQVRVTLEVRPGSGPAVSENGGVVNAARMSAYGEPGLLGPRLLPLAPGAIVQVRGRNFTGGESFAASGLPLPERLGGVRVLLNEQAAPLFAVEAGRITAQLPSAGLLTEGEAVAFASVVVETGRGSSYPRVLPIAAYAPGVFTVSGSGTGQGSVVFAGTADLAAARGYRSGSRPARAGDIVEIYMTGLGALEPPLAAGEAADGSVLRRAAAPVRAWLGGLPLAPEAVLFAGAAPGLAGVNVVLVRLPPGLAPSEAAEIRIAAGGRESQPGVTIAVE